ncbi:MAG: BlaI/MecI/CopY family transcriptional regulator [Hyphomonas sp.]
MPVLPAMHAFWAESGKRAGLVKNTLTVGFIQNTLDYQFVPEGSYMSVRTGKIALGPLEISILRYLWRKDGAEVKTVFRELGESDANSLNTVQSAMERLFRKGLLSREKVSHAYVYRAEVNRMQMISRVIDDILQSFTTDSKDSYLLAFLDHAVESDTQALDMLEQMIKDKREEAAAKSGEGNG